MQEEIIVENGIKSILQKIFDYYYSYKRTCKTVALGELIGIATKENKGLSDSVQALNSTIYNISTGNKETALFKVCDYGSNINHILHIYSSPNGTLDSCNYIRVILSDKYIFVNKLFEKGYNSIRLFKDRKSFYVYVYSSVWTRTKIEVFQRTLISSISQT